MVPRLFSQGIIRRETGNVKQPVPYSKRKEPAGKDPISRTDSGFPSGYKRFICHIASGNLNTDREESIMEFFNEDPVPSERITDKNDVFTMDTAIAGNIKKT